MSALRRLATLASLSLLAASCAEAPPEGEEYDPAPDRYTGYIDPKFKELERATLTMALAEPGGETSQASAQVSARLELAKELLREGLTEHGFAAAGDDEAPQFWVVAFAPADGEGDFTWPCAPAGIWGAWAFDYDLCDGFGELHVGDHPDTVVVGLVDAGRKRLVYGTGLIELEHTENDGAWIEDAVRTLLRLFPPPEPS